MGLSIELRDKTLRQALLKKRMQMTNEMERVVEVGATLIAEAWVLSVPVDSGHYRDSIHVEMYSTSDRHATAVAKSGVQGDYDVFLEYGTRFHAAQPSARIAFEGTKEAVSAWITSSVKKAAGV